ncbi:hypothetical protein [Bradyrhizobium sp. SZCCHNS3055]|uniref:hypothetical protein n=1 Tax=Bradyrhizobium sp. SZCCHNS3055 TaxID=3057323 RepID=UPI0028E924D8|nr:hypothetical protein [Bradyrhizobium sp. SZCCHNS3055]
MTRGKQPPVSHALQKQQTLLDCFLEAQAKRLGRRPAGSRAGKGQPGDNASTGNELRKIAGEEPAE